MPSAGVSRSRRLPVAAFMLVLGLVGCGGSSPKPAVMLNTKRVEQAIEHAVLVQRHLRVTAVCPLGVAQQKGLTFRCVVTYLGQATTFKVDQLDDRGNVHYVGE